MGNRQEALMQEAVRYVQLIVSSYLGSAEKVFRWGLGVGGWGLGVGGWGLGVGVWGVGCGILPIFRWSIT
jgi:hypothetical protein